MVRSSRCGLRPARETRLPALLIPCPGGGILLGPRYLLGLLLRRHVRGALKRFERLLEAGTRAFAHGVSITPASLAVEA